jgi:mRNA interferase MazF
MDNTDKKQFDIWNQRKKEIDSNAQYKHPRVREIWWCSVGINIGREVFGKGEDFARPVLVINAEGSENFIGIPLTSNIKRKKYSCIIKTNDGVAHTLLVYQIRNFDKRRLTKRKYVLSLEEYSKVEEYIHRLYKI